MADYYVRATDGDNGNPGTPAAPKLNLAGFQDAASAGDRAYVSNLHRYSYNAATVITLPGTTGSTPNEVLCIEDWGAETDPGSITHTLSTGAYETSGSTYNFTINGGSTYFYGLEFNASPTSNTSRQLTVGGTYNILAIHVYHKCILGITSGQVYLHNNTGNWGNRLIFRNCQFRFGNAAACARIFINVEWINTEGQQLVLGTAPTKLFSLYHSIYSSPSGYFEGLDLSNISGTIIKSDPYVSINVGVTSKTIFNRCKLHASATLADRGNAVGAPIIFTQCDSGTNFLHNALYNYPGTVTEDTVRIRTASTTTFSQKFVTSANSKFYYPLNGFPIAKINVVEGTPITVNVYTLTDGVTLTNGDAGVDISYFGSASYPLGSIASSAKANFLASAANYDTTTEAWTTTDIASPVKQVIPVTFTPQKSGYIIITPWVAKASTTVYFDTDPSVT